MKGKDGGQRTEDGKQNDPHPGTGIISDNWGLLGHEWAVEMLKQHIRHDSVRHAYLFSGPPGLGRRSLALRFAQALNCPNPIAPGEACRNCKTCQQIERMQYPDLAVIEADKDGGTLKVEQIRSIRQSLSLKPYQGKYRVALFLRFQEANQNAANALLKTLEEAPAHVVLLLTTDTAEQLLPTITSRCETLRLRPLPVEVVENYLIKQGATAESAHLLAHISGGRPGYALHLMEDKDALKFREDRLKLLLDLLKANRHGRFVTADNLANFTKKGTKETRERFRETLLLWLSFWQDVFLSVAGSEAPLTNVDYTEAINDLATKLLLPETRRLVGAGIEAIDKLERNVNTRLLAEVILMDWPRIA